LIKPTISRSEYHYATLFLPLTTMAVRRNDIASILQIEIWQRLLTKSISKDISIASHLRSTTADFSHDLPHHAGMEEHPRQGWPEEVAYPRIIPRGSNNY
jgi:hypothetical protein